MVREAVGAGFWSYAEQFMASSAPDAAGEGRTVVARESPAAAGEDRRSVRETRRSGARRFIVTWTGGCLPVGDRSCPAGSGRASPGAARTGEQMDTAPAPCHGGPDAVVETGILCAGRRPSTPLGLSVACAPGMGSAEAAADSSRLPCQHQPSPERPTCPGVQRALLSCSGQPGWKAPPRRIRDQRQREASWS